MSKLDSVKITSTEEVKTIGFMLITKDWINPRVIFKRSRGPDGPGFPRQSSSTNICTNHITLYFPSLAIAARKTQTYIQCPASITNMSHIPICVCICPI